MAERDKASSEEDLVVAFRRDGDETAFRDLFRRHSPTMYALARRMLGQGGEAEDAVQEAWVRAVGALATFGWRSSLRTWLVGITINCCREILRVRSPGLQFGAEIEPPPAAATAEKRLDLERAIESLPDGYRAVLVLHDVEGLTHAEIADRLGIDPGTSKSQLSRARRALRTFWSAPSLAARS